jgi:ABC-type transport system substrate-binding protein
MRSRSSAAAALALLLLAVSCTDSDQQPRKRSTLPYQRGGTLRVTLFDWMNHEFNSRTEDGAGDYALDPQYEPDPVAWELLRCCLVRTLMSYNGRPTGEGGAVPRPDLAAGAPVVSSDGLTWTFRLKQGLHYAPPLEDTEIVAQDFIRSLERGLAPGRFPHPERDGAFLPINTNYDYLYWIIRGARDYQNGDVSVISGLEAPDTHTLRVHLTHPVGDIPYRFAMPFTAPVPTVPSDPTAPFGVAAGHEDGYGRFLVSSGPYMIEGSESLDFSAPPANQRPVSGYVPGIRLTFVRNPSWDPTTDPLRAAYADRIELTLDTNGEAHDRQAADMRAGRIDVAYFVEGAADAEHEELIPEYRADPDLAKRLFIYPADFVNWISMNVAVPPFDDVHVRKAVNLVTDKAAIQRLSGGQLEGNPAGHLAWDSVEGNILVTYDPYATPGHRGDTAAAQAEMRRSAYDHDRDGRCDDVSACRDVPVLVPYDPTFPNYLQTARILRSGLARLGVELSLHRMPFEEYFPFVDDPANHTALFLADGAIKDYPNGSAFFQRFTANPVPDHSLVGASPADLRAWGYDVTDVPDVGWRYDRCAVQTGSAEVQCWADLDQYLMEQVVPWVPLLFHNRQRIVSSRVLDFSYDQFTALPALEQLPLRAGTSPSPMLAPPSPASVPPIPAGSYRFTVTEADLLRFGVPTDPRWLEENSGSFTLTIGDGSWTIVQTGPHRYFAPVNEGHYLGFDDQVTFVTDRPFVNAGSSPPMGWSLDGNALRFEVDGCGDLEAADCATVTAAFEAHPWERVG